MNEHFWIIAPRLPLAMQTLHNLQINPHLPDIRVIHGTLEGLNLQGYRGVVKLIDPDLELPTHVFDELMYLTHTGRFRWWTDDDTKYLQGLTALGLPKD